MRRLERLLADCAVVFALGATLLGALALATPTSAEVGATPGIRYCCTPQQVAACSAKGGTTSCRTNVCQCLF